MGWEAWYTLGIIGLIFIGLVGRLGPPDVLMLGGTVAVGLVGIITPTEAFSGLSNQGMLTVAALFVVAAALRETGVLDAIGQRIMGNSGNEKTALLRLAPPVVGISAFLNNTPVVAMLLPAIRDWCRKNRVSPSRLMLPISYLAILGGTCTLIGTSTNLVVNGMMIDQGQGSISFFEFAYVGVPFALVGTTYMFVLGRRLLPDRKDLLERLGESPREYLVDMRIEPGCRLIDKQVEEAGLRRLAGLFLIEISRGNRIISPVRPDEILRANDILTFTGVVSHIVDLERIPGLVPVGDQEYVTESSKRRQQRLCEAVISGTSPLIYHNIREANFRALYNAAVVAVHRGGSRLKKRIGDIVLQPGDTLLLQTGPHFAQAHRNNPDFFLVSNVEGARPVRHDKAPISILLLVALIVLMTMSTNAIIPIPIAMVAFLIAGLMIVTRCLSATQARQSIDMQLLITIAAAFGMAHAVHNSGVAQTISGLVTIFDSGTVWGKYAALATVYLVTILLTEMTTNNAAAVLIFPVAMAVADGLDVNFKPFAMAVAFAASASFVTPIGYQTNMMVYGPGGYQFTDFIRVGLPLSIILFLLAVFLIPMVWTL